MSNIIDTIQLSGTVYTIQGSGGAVSSAITSGDTNPVEGGVLYDELRVIKTSLEEIEWEEINSSYCSTNYPNGCKKISVEIWSGTYDGFTFLNGEAYVGYAEINKDEELHTFDVYTTNGITYTTSGDVVTFSYPSLEVTQLMRDFEYDSIVTAIMDDVTPLIDQVSANTQAITGKQDTLSAGTGIQISGNVISATGGGGGNPTVELTQAEYDDLVSAGTVSADTYYIITDATPVDMGNYWTSAQTNSAINQATSGKANTSDVYTKSEVDDAITAATYDKVHSISFDGISSGHIDLVYTTDEDASYEHLFNVGEGLSMVYDSEGEYKLVTTGSVATSAITSAVTSGSTDSEIPTAKAVFDAIPTGSSITVSSAITSGDTNPIAGGAVYDKFDEVEQVTARALIDLQDNKLDASAYTPTDLSNYYTSAQTDSAIAQAVSGKVDTSSVTSAATSGSTDVITSGGVYAQMGGLKLQQISQADYDALVSGGTVDNSTLYIITNVVN